jgi:hypothetical protein
MDLQTTLILILSIGFFVLLVLSIVLVASVIIILRRVQRVTSKLESITDNIPDVLKSLGKKIGPVAVTTILGAVTKHLASRRSKT